MQICFLSHFYKLRVLVSHNSQSSPHLEYPFQQQAEALPLLTVETHSLSDDFGPINYD